MGARDSISLTPDTPSHTPFEDHASDRHRLTLPVLERFLEDLRNEPPWRALSDRCADFYDGNQLTPEELEELEENGLGDLMRNVIAPTVNAVLGLEERNRTDWKVKSDYEDEADVAEALSAKMAEAERNTEADNAISEAYAGQIKAGFAAVEVSRASNPFDYKYRVHTVHRRELYWDPRSRRNDWKDARYLVRKRWYDVDVACAFFPKHARLLKYSVGGWLDWRETVAGDEGMTDLAQSRKIERGTSFESLDWLDEERERVCIHEVWYRTWHRGLVMKLPRDRVVEYDEKNPRHVAMRASRMVDVSIAVYDKIRRAYFVGPHRLSDVPTKLRDFPYIPFWGYREDRNGSPYGLVRSMLSVQEEVNARLAKMMWLLTARRTMIDADAVDVSENTLSDVSREMGNADGFIVLNPNRVNGTSAIAVDENLQLASAQRDALQDAIASLQTVSGVYSIMLGNSSGGVTAGNAIDKLVDQSANTLAEINGNYTWGRRKVGNQLMALIKQDLTGEMDVTVDNGTSKRMISINKRSVDPVTGLTRVENSVQNTTSRVALADVPSSPAYREQQFAQLSEFAKSLKDEAQDVFAPFIIEATDLPNRREIAKLVRERLGVFDEKTPEGQQARAAADKVAADQAEQARAVIQAQIDESNAKTGKSVVETELLKAEGGEEADGKISELNKINEDYRAEINELTRKLLASEIDRELEQLRIDNEKEVKLKQIKSEDERTALEIESRERIAKSKQIADDKFKEIQGQFSQFGEEFESKLSELKESKKSESKPDKK